MVGIDPIINQHTWSDAFVREKYEVKSTAKAVLNWAISIFRAIGYAFTALAARVFNLGWKEQIHNDPKWKEDSQGLYVFFHGLMGSPRIFNSHLAELEKKLKFDLFAPMILKGGNCNIEEAAEKNIDKIVDYAKAHPHNPICITGVSNGARIALYVEKQLRTRCQVAVRVNLIAGAHFGTPRMNTINGSTCLRKIFLYTPEIREALSYRSQKVNALLREVIESNQKDPPRCYQSYLSTNDIHIPKMDVLMLPDQPEPVVVHGYDHNSIVKGIHQAQLHADYQWMKANKR